MDNEREINSLVAENIALQWVLTQVLFRLGDLDPRVKGAIKSGFDDAAIGVRDLGYSFRQSGCSPLSRRGSARYRGIADRSAWQ